MSTGSHKQELEFTALDGSNPLAFLAALGTLRSLSLAWPEADISVRWQKNYAWTPVLGSSSPIAADIVIEALMRQLNGTHKSPYFVALGDDLNVKPEKFKEFARNAADDSRPDNRVWADFAAAFGCEATSTRDGSIQDTAFRTMSGAGHQHFLASMRAIAEKTEEVHLRKALFEPWKYDDPVTKLTLRWDPVDDVRYALRWRDPSGDPARERRGAVLGANRLAIEGLPLFPAVPLGGQLYTTGFRGRKSTDTFWTWPIWDCPLTVHVVRTVLAYPELQADAPNRASLAHLGIVEVYRSQRITVGKLRNFSPPRSVDQQRR